MKGLFVTIEGGEGAGKSTLQKKLAARLRKAGHEVVLTREPGGTRLGRRLRKELLDGGHVVPVAELMLYAADRAQHVAEVLAPALQRGAIVVCDRFSDSTTAYQGFGRKLSKQHIHVLNAMAQQGLEPRVTFWLDLPAMVGLARTRKRGKADRLEAEAVEFHERVRRGFRSIAKTAPGRVFRIDATRPPDDVFEAAWGVLASRLES